MKKRDLYWVNKIVIFLLITLFFGGISILNILQFNASFIKEEQEELQVFKRQIEWAAKPFLLKNDTKMLQKYCDDFQNEDIEFRIFDKNRNLIATSSPENTSPLAENNSKNAHHDEFNLLKVYQYALEDKKIVVIENIGDYFLELTVSQASVLKTVMTGQKSVVVFFVMCILFWLIGLIQVFYTLRKSFNKLEDSVIEVANGNLDEEIDVPKIDLLKELTVSIKKMVKRLKNQIVRLSQLEQYKTNFLQNITHEIKTPITAINSAVELLETKNSLDENDRECFDIIRFQTKSINKLVNDILALSEIEIEKTNEDKNFEKIDLNSMVERVIAYMSFSDVKIDFVPKNEVEIFANEELLATALSNLLSNAIRYSESEKIDVNLAKDGDIVELSVQDYGVGIAEEHLGHLFERFYRVDKNRSRKLGGSGLGLAIVKNIVELHGGTISVESKLGKGTKFLMRF